MRGLLLVTTALLLCGVVSGQADAATSRAAQAPHRDITFHDTTLPNGRHRSLAVANATANSCYASTGTSRQHNPTQAFKDCMETQGFRWMSTKDVGGAPTKRVASGIPVKGNFIDPDTGLHCHNTGWATICDGGVASGDDEPASAAADNNDWAAQQEQSATDAANAGYAQDAATAAANVAAAATFDAQMTVGN
jgi:hypothetical protein